MSAYHSGPPPSSEGWPIFVISLTSSTDRRRTIARQFNAMNLNFSFIDAIDGRSGLPQQYDELVDRSKVLERRGYPMSDGEIACALSHRQAYLQVVEDRLDGAIIMEDDVILTRNFDAFYRGKGYLRAEFIQLCYYEARVWRGRGTAGPDGMRIFRLSENAFMSAGYSISRRAAMTLLAATTPISERADWPCEVTRLGARLIYPRIVNHPPQVKAQSLLAEGRRDLIPDGFDFSAGYAKGWKRLFTPASWKSFIRNRLSRRITYPF